MFYIDNSYDIWPPSPFLTFAITAEMKTKCKIWPKCQFSHRTVNHKKICNVPLDALMCPLQIINNIESLLLTLHGVSACFIHYPSNVKNYSISHKLGNWSTKNKKNVSELHIFTPFCKFFDSKFKIPITTEIQQIFQHLGNRHLTAQQMAHKWHTQKSEIG